MKHFILQTAKQTGCKEPATISCQICKNTFMAGKTPSMFIYYEEINCSLCIKFNKGNNEYHSHCDWLCSELCTELWILRASNPNRGVKVK